jgi:hypothetical protein
MGSALDDCRGGVVPAISRPPNPNSKTWQAGFCDHLAGEVRSRSVERAHWQPDRKGQTKQDKITLVRHPMCAAAFLYLLGTPLVPGSWIGLALLPFVMGLLIVRIFIEEAELRKGLPGYNKACSTAICGFEPPNVSLDCRFAKDEDSRQWYARFEDMGELL